VISDTKAVTVGDFEMHSARQRTPEEWSSRSEIRVSALNIQSVSLMSVNFMGSYVRKFASQEVVFRGTILFTSWYVTPYNLVALYRLFGRMYFHHFELCLLGLLFNLEDEVCFSETSANIYQTTRCQIPEDGSRNSRRRVTCTPN
jgi:hypothetical protein